MSSLTMGFHGKHLAKYMYMYMYERGIEFYRIAGNIGGELYLADWQFSCHTANIKSANLSANIVPTPGEGVAIVP